ncbi:hypothetical protein SARC_03327 [Sphaeroforma arctica JP610]|uniref:N-alpha-acetyltransferase 40 n=1 Tax=Sphaeroforma arctica JP610 TaxID=667725 RepID=A0A0L0G887_9EUKA|nr:hypothetical protein SARC_03327 [Sphaeroforma arctica JP610]KNC84463.1 hypothetical protein SARC_03327 [Sphaeroforma arctica JP610]|eukprot:XP_014158365.1 hypothetical protein SARC_03327 [Sphaeroforma arctica JP610]
MGEQKAVLHADCVSANACVTLDELLPVSNKGYGEISRGPDWKWCGFEYIYDVALHSHVLAVVIRAHGREDRSFAFIRSQDLAKGEIKAIFNLTKANVSHYYAEWSDEEKMEELRSPTSRYLLVENNEDEDSLSYKAITSFRFEMDDFEVLPIMYCYELQVAQDFRGQGLGKTLLKALEDIGRHRRMRQVVLTVQKALTPTLVMRWTLPGTRALAVVVPWCALRGVVSSEP